MPVGDITFDSLNNQCSEKHDLDQRASVKFFEEKRGLIFMMV